MIRGRPFAKIESGAAGGLDPLHIAAVSAQTDAVPLPVCIVTDHSPPMYSPLAGILAQILTAEIGPDTMTLKYEAAAVNLLMASPRTSTENVVIDPIAFASHASAIPTL
jgi:hypothetical protein